MNDLYTTLKVGRVDVRLYNDDRIAQSVRGGKPFEPKTLALYGDSVKPNTRVLDIGCYSGLFSIAACKLGAYPTGFEPFNDNRTQIEKNKLLNNVEFQVLPAAVSDSVGRARLGYNARVHLTSGASLERKSGPGMDVPTTTIDEFDRRSDMQMPISIIKMDVERHEPAVIRGARLTIDRYRPLLIIEANDEEMKTKVLQALEGLNYGLTATLDERNLIFSPRS